MLNRKEDSYQSLTEYEIGESVLAMSKLHDSDRPDSYEREANNHVTALRLNFQGCFIDDEYHNEVLHQLHELYVSYFRNRLLKLSNKPGQEKKIGLLDIEQLHNESEVRDAIDHTFKNILNDKTSNVEIEAILENTIFSEIERAFSYKQIDQESYNKIRDEVLTLYTRYYRERFYSLLYGAAKIDTVNKSLIIIPGNDEASLKSEVPKKVRKKIKEIPCGYSLINTLESGKDLRHKLSIISYDDVFGIKTKYSLNLVNNGNLEEKIRDIDAVINRTNMMISNSKGENYLLVEPLE